MYDTVVLENGNNNSTRKFKCPYCDLRDTRYNLVYHVQDEHEDLLPEGYTPARVVFNYINKKDSGRCIMCKKPTEWNEDRWKYERLCNSKKCHDKYVKMVKGRMLKKYNKEHLLDDEEVQKKMLNNRRISGEYKFKDGGVRNYVGTYEKNALQFCEELGYKSSDIITPGPTIIYDYKGKKHKWITDIFIIPSNLVIDVKDGGSNPNTRDMKDYRAKQNAKEKAISEQGEYNYLRLTDNDFSQLLYILAEIKQQLTELPDGTEKGDTIVEINEYCSAVAGAIPPESQRGVYMVPCLIDNVFVDTKLATDDYLSDLYNLNNGNMEKINRDDLDYYDEYTLLKYTPKHSDLKLENIMNTINEAISNMESYNKNSLYEALTGKEVIDDNQIFMDSDFEEVLDKSIYVAEQNRIENVTIETNAHKLNGLPYINIPLFEHDKITESVTLLGKHNLVLEVKEDLDGYFIENIKTGKRSSSYKSLKDIPDYLPGILANN